MKILADYREGKIKRCDHRWKTVHNTKETDYQQCKKGACGARRIIIERGSQERADINFMETGKVASCVL